MADRIRVAIYVRISDDREGSGLGVARQEADCRRRAESLGWDVVAVFVDNDLSAFKNKTREGYEQLVAAIETRHIDALLCWHTDRLHRNVRQLLDFLDVVKERDEQHPDRPFMVQTVQAGSLDLSSPTGRAMAITYGAWAEQESGHKAKRIKGKIAELVQAGKVHNGGPRPFGYTRIYSGEGPRRKILRDEINEEEAAIVRECVDRTLAGESKRSIVASLNQRGIKTTTGGSWSIQGLRTMLMSGRIAGLKEHNGVVIGPASWPKIIDPEEHELLRSMLASKGRQPGHGPRKHYLTGIVRCSCDEQRPKKMRVVIGHGKLKYACQPKVEDGCGGRVIMMSDLEILVEDYVFGRARDPHALKELVALEESAESESNAIIEAIEKDERRLTILQDQLVDGDEEDLSTIVKSVKRLEARIQENRDRLAIITGAVSLVGIDMTDLDKRWRDMPVEHKRKVTAMFIDMVIIHPTTVRGRFDHSRVQIMPRGQAALRR
ncbi:recombinase family protein [Sphaerisporangium rhizosphaerae]|uniref:Recombinase family protein n=1 Tax=Sphaerisporangium rhizosphaerae TaxID=2269375 RepID=A0ABW2NXC0_9ACTN